jgi:hypothetical protein
LCRSTTPSSIWTCSTTRKKTSSRNTAMQQSQQQHHARAPARCGLTSGFLRRIVGAAATSAASSSRNASGTAHSVLRGHWPRSPPVPRGLVVSRTLS